MRNTKTLQEQTIKNNFLFAAVMLEPENCKGLLELVLGIAIDRVEVDREKCLIYHPEYKSVRLDVYARDENQTCYNVEMQVADAEIKKRSRYYHCQIDMELLEKGIPYEELPDSIVIFICDYDPLGLKKYRYTIQKTIKEFPEKVYEDGSYTIFLSTAGENSKEEPAALVAFLNYVHAGLEDSDRDFGDSYVAQLQKAVRQIKSDREMGARYMLFGELLREEFNAGKLEGKAEGKAEFILELLSSFSPISEKLENQIRSINDLTLLSELHRLAAKADSMETFEKQMELCVKAKQK